MLGDADPGVCRTVSMSLRDLTDMYFEQDADAWREWWADSKDTFKVPPRRS
jgi:hypothetical protein